MQGLCLPNSFSPPFIVTKMLHMFLNSVHHYQCKPPHSSLSNDPTDVCLPTKHIFNLPQIMTVTQLLQNCPVFYPVVHYCVNMSPQWTRPLANKSCPHTTSNFLKIHSNTILPTFIKSPKWYRPFRISDWSFIFISYLSYIYWSPYGRA